MTHIGKFFVFKGELSSDEDLRFDGTLKGHLYIDGAKLSSYLYEGEACAFTQTYTYAFPRDLV